jgi:hypothetical protein
VIEYRVTKAAKKRDDTAKDISQTNTVFDIPYFQFMVGKKFCDSEMIFNDSFFK